MKPFLLAKNMQICSVHECGKYVFCKGLCNPHYQKKRLYGTTAGNPIVSKGYVDDLGYKMLSINGIKVREHIAVAEKAFGGKLPSGVVVHHVNENKLDNRGSNLVICHDEAYHQLLHRRQRALDECGNANFRQCSFCREWSPESGITINKANSNAYHAECRNADRREKYSKNGAKK